MPCFCVVYLIGWTFHLSTISVFLYFNKLLLLHQNWFWLLGGVPLLYVRLGSNKTCYSLAFSFLANAVLHRPAFYLVLNKKGSSHSFSLMFGFLMHISGRHVFLMHIVQRSIRTELSDFSILYKLRTRGNYPLKSNLKDPEGHLPSKVIQLLLVSSVATGNQQKVVCFFMRVALNLGAEGLSIFSYVQ